MFRFLKYSENLLQQNLDFEHVILENALENIVGKFGRHLQIIKPVLERLLEPIEKVEQKKAHLLPFNFLEPRDKWTEASVGR